MKISIIVPIYKVEKELPRCIECLVNQTYKDIEIILVNDGSPDRCFEICMQYAKKDARIQVINKENGGLSDARNAGIERATGEYFFVVDSDDYIDLDTCELFLKSIKDEYPDIAVGDYVEERAHLQILHKHTNIVPDIVYSAESFIQNALEASEMRMEAWPNMYRLSFWKENDFSFKKGILHEDMQLIPRVFLGANKIMYIKKAFYHYVIREGSIMYQNNRDKRYKDIMETYAEWNVLANSIKNERIKYLFRCLLSKCFMYSCTVLNVENPDYRVVSRKHLVKYSKDVKECIKAVLFIIMPKIYFKIYQLTKK